MGSLELWLDNVQAGEMVEFPGGIQGMALNLEATTLVLLSSAQTVTLKKAIQSSVQLTLTYLSGQNC